MNFENLSIRSRLYLGFSIVLLMLLILVGLGITKVNFISTSLTQITDINSVKQRYAINFRGSVHDRAIAFRDITLATSPNQIQKNTLLIDQLRRFYNESEQGLQSMLDNGVFFGPEEIQILKRIADIKIAAIPLTDNIISLVNQGQVDTAKAQVVEQVGDLYAEWLDVINQFIDYQENANQVATPKAREVADGFQSIMVIISSIALIISIFVVRVIKCNLYSSLGGEPRVAVASLSTIEQGDLTLQVLTQYPNSLLATLEKMKNKLQSTVSNIIFSAKDLSAQAEFVQKRSEEATGKATTQANLTLETLDNLTVMKQRLDEISTIALNTEINSRETTQYSKEGISIIDKSSTAMEDILNTVNTTVLQIQKLEETTKEIGSIVGVISSISEQTNLLALNAAIEAARAGESGRGFAVVADEVRELAKRTGSATSQIENMINEVQQETQASVSAMETTQPLVQSGKELTNQTTELLKKIEQQAQTSLTNVNLVASQTSEQVELISQVSSAMSEINNMSSESIKSMNENVDAVKKLNAISQNLSETVNYFKVDS